MFLNDDRKHRLIQYQTLLRKAPDVDDFMAPIIDRQIELLDMFLRQEMDIPSYLERDIKEAIMVLYPGHP